MMLGKLLVTAMLLGVLTSSTALAQEPRPNAQRVPGTFALDESTAEPTVVAPETARAGQEFQVTITTIGSGCEEQGDEGVILGNRIANIHVYDFTTATKPGVACTLIFKQFKHTVTLSFAETGTANIRVWGRHTGRYYPGGGTPVTLEVPITITP